MRVQYGTESIKIHVITSTFEHKFYAPDFFLYIGGAEERDFYKAILDFS